MLLILTVDSPHCYAFFSLHTHTHIHTTCAVLGNVTTDLETPPCFNGIFYVRASLSFRCLLPASNPPIENVSWYYVQGSGSSEQLLGFSLPDFSSTPAENTYSISILRMVDAGNYFCRVDNGVLSRDSNRVLLPPVMTKFLITVSKWLK